LKNNFLPVVEGPVYSVVIEVPVDGDVDALVTCVVPVDIDADVDDDDGCILVLDKPTRIKMHINIDNSRND